MNVGWARVGLAMAVAWGFFITMILLGVYVFRSASPESPVFSYWDAATGGGTMVLFILILFAPRRRRAAAALPRE